MKQKVFNIIISIAVIALIVSYVGPHSKDIKYKPPEVIVDTLEYKQHFHSKLPQDGLMEALIYYDVKYPHIVYAQAVIETGNFKSGLCLNDNNLFGLYNSNKGKYHSFNHWTESVVAYKNFIQYKYKPSENYYEFLQRIGYAEDTDYISKLKKAVNKNDKRRSE